EAVEDHFIGPCSAVDMIAAVALVPAEHVISRAEDGGVASLAPDDQVIAVARRTRVVAGAAQECVVSVAAIDRVVSRASVDGDVDEGGEIPCLCKRVLALP